MTIRWVKCCDDFWIGMQELELALQFVVIKLSKPISHCPWCGAPITVEGEPEQPAQILKILAADPKAN